jgi:hypothetical protein
VRDVSSGRGLADAVKEHVLDLGGICGALSGALEGVRIDAHLDGSCLDESGAGPW